MARTTTKRRAQAKRPSGARTKAARTGGRTPGSAPGPGRQAPRDVTRDALLDAALALAAEQGWRAVTLSGVAERADVPLAEASRCFATRAAIVQAFIRRIDAAMLDAVGSGAAEGSARDRLFDVVMSRFDAMTPYRAQIADLARALPADPALALGLGTQVLVSAGWLMAAARLDGNGPLALLRGAGVAALFLDALRVWLGDDSEDMAKTMAALDRNLRRAERIARLLDRPQRRSAPPPA